MFSTKRMKGLYLTLALLVTGDAFLLGACSHSCCKSTNSQTFEDANGKIVDCFQYTNGGTSCYTCCGVGSFSEGYCQYHDDGFITDCDSTDVCVGTNMALQFQLGSQLGDACAIANNYNENDSGCLFLENTKTNETLCDCGPPVSGAKACQ